MPEREGVWDAGLQPERTRLAWRRTTLSLVVGGLVGARVLGDAFGPVGLAASAAALGGGCLLALLARQRAARTTTALAAGQPLPDARVLLVAAALPAACAVLGAIGVLL